MTSTTTTPGFRFLGITDENTACDRCGKMELRSTIVLAALDVDGNEEDIVYYGSTCAAKALSWTGKGQGRKVLDLARNAHRRTLETAREARETLAHYELPETGKATDYQLQYAVLQFQMNHRNAHWFDKKAPADWREMTRDMFTRRQAQIADAAKLGF